MLKLALNWFVGGGFSFLTDIYNKTKDSKVAEDQIQATWAAQQLAAMAANRAATSGYWEMRLLTFCIGGIFTLHLILVGIDTMFGWTWNGQRVPAWPKPMNEWEGAVILSFFGLTAGVIGIKAIAGAFRR